MSRPLLSARDLRNLRAVRESELQLRAVGGDRWTVTRRSGDGVGSPTTPATIGEARALIGELPAGKIGETAPGSLLAPPHWELIVIADGPALLPEDTLTSVADTSKVFRLRAVTDRYLHETWEVLPQ